ncbi:MAG: preprotein translocase subunit SecG [Candidatus Pacebacteria bacterium CG10_big_fil_rev_8_21_14_0_10_36_11]|nr:preprotein translocase subunit SecG [Candidatus Pacearchaeota archaeon]OIP73621.1 MAG: preprotein translocase subunit SecG [Candidatus Pacebacteria bacterium CG2_30_36_39]PIR64797.1 MAG: preprotein translocase subunit SecG [Candidatus Pacebacteria bacterium CG10_big_fil_rev_8_21_14_0_10_36_11]PJC43100.1 MAG: preprotein translocase subunit SecG [Candidatus Pacebacteria bacterium CG_4_9_14_0_2_um_filter_36_8]
MNSALLVIQIILAIIITAFILLQAQGSGLGSTWGGGGETYHTRRGVERVVFILTIVAIVLFAAVSIAAIA